MVNRWSARPIGGDGELSDLLREKLGWAKKQVEIIDERLMINDNEEILLGRLVAQSELALVQVDEARTQRSGFREVTLTVPDVFGGEARVPGFSLEVEVPLSGDWGLLAYRASQRTLGGSPGQIDDGKAVLVIEGRKPAIEEINAQVDRFLEGLRDHVAWLNVDLEAFNARLKQEVADVFQARKQRLLAVKQIDAQLTIPLKRVGESQPRSVETRRRIIKPSPSQAVATSAQSWMLDAEQYRDVLQVCRDWVTCLQRTPRSVEGLGEEALRDLLLATLNTHWEGAAASEVFNGEGKTDILVRQDNRQVFIGECKKWTGPKAAVQAIDQLLGYLTWEDCKAALIVFIDGAAKPKQTIAKLAGAVDSHAKVLGKVTDLVVGIDQYVVDAGEGRRIELAVIPVVLMTHAGRDTPHAEGS